MYSLLRAKANGLRNGAIDLAQQLIQTGSPSLDEGKVGDLVLEAMRSYGYGTVHRDTDGNVIGILPGRSDAPCVLLNCHMDTVPASSGGKDWSVAPLAGEIREGRLYGLGAADCKGPGGTTLCRHVAQAQSAAAQRYPNSSSHGGRRKWRQPWCQNPYGENAAGAWLQTGLRHSGRTHEHGALLRSRWLARNGHRGNRFR